MCEYLPYKDFKWNNDEWNTEKILNLDDHGETGYLFSVDVTLNKKYHEHFNQYPLFPENICIKKNDLNEWQKEDYMESKIQKLCLTFNDKKNYVVNYRYLKLCLSLGYELIKVNKVLEYKQSDFLKKYIMLNTELRKISKNDFEKDFFKLMNNSVYGKTMENVRNRINFRLISTDEEALRVKNLKKFTIFNEDLVGVHINKSKVKLFKPIYLGQCILDDSKVLMSNFHYNFMLKKIERENIDLLFTDTDSLCYHIRKQDVFEIIKENSDEFDLSNYQKDNILYNSINNKVIGKMKNESPDKQIIKFIGLRSKLYSYVCDTEEIAHNKCKGIKRYKSVKFTIQNYNNTLTTRLSLPITQNMITCRKHKLYSQQQTKIALSCYDDKIKVSQDNIRCFNFGYNGNQNTE